MAIVFAGIQPVSTNSTVFQCHFLSGIAVVNALVSSIDPLYFPDVPSLGNADWVYHVNSRSDSCAIETKVIGEVSFEVADPEAFVGNPETFVSVKEAIASTSGINASEVTITRYKIGNGPWRTYDDTRSRQLRDASTSAASISYDFEVSTSTLSAASVLAAASAVVPAVLVQVLNTALTTHGVAADVTGASVAAPVAVERTKAGNAIISGTPAPTVASSTFADSAALGDPHVTNIYGERFDINRAGAFVLIQIPRDDPTAKSLLTVDGEVQHGTICTKMLWITRLRVGGSLLGDKYEFGITDDANAPFFMGVGNTTTRNLEEFENMARLSEVTVEKNVAHMKVPGPRLTIHVGAAAVVVDLVKLVLKAPTGDHHIDINVQNMRSLVHTQDLVGGLLGIDDHTFASEKAMEECYSRPRSLMEGAFEDFTGSSTLKASM